MHYKLVIFDFDGTLADSFPMALNIADQMADRHGFSRIDRSQIQAMRSLSITTLLKKYKISLWKLPFLLRDVRRIMNDSVDQIFLFDGIKELLAQLSTRGTRLAVVTSNSRQNVQQVLGKETAALVEYYECGVGLFGKRDRFQKILKKSGFSREEIICIGDETRDIDAARSANLICAAVAWGYAGLDVLEAHKPNFIFFNVEQLAQAILE